MLLQLLLATAAILCIARNLLLTWKNLTRFPASIPWIGRRHEAFSRVRACGREIFGGGLESMKAGYEAVRAILLRPASPSSLPPRPPPRPYSQTRDY